MKTIIVTFCLLCITLTASAQPPAANETMSRLSRSAEQELAQSVKDLNQLRDQIAGEKLPLAQELTTLEEKLAQRRRDYEKVTRLADTGNLELPAIKAEMKARQDELGYVANLLDEYARTFDTKVNVSEMQHLGAAIETAKQAKDNSALTMSEKFTQQTEFVGTSTKRLVSAIGGLRFPGVGVDLQGRVTEGQFAIIGPVALFGGKNGGVAGLVVPQSGSAKPLIRPLEGDMQAGLAALVTTGEGILPFDPSSGGALKALVQKTNLFAIFEKGGPIMWPLLFASILAMATVLERFLFLFIERTRRDSKGMEKFLATVAQGDTELAIRNSSKSKFYVLRALNYALAHKGESLENALIYAQAREIKRYQRGIPVLDTVITLAPLLGLLGTVTGMMGTFSLLGGDFGAPSTITGGIAEALIATAFGLIVAITSLIPFNFLNTRLEQARIEIESSATQLELLLNRSTAKVETPAQPALVGQA